EGIETVANRTQAEFQRLDEETKQWHNDKNPIPLWWFIRIPALILAIILAILTIIFSFIASFIWNPDKKREKLA
ncbi:1-acyl-sn-glycerol-3-phosphate acyltransferase, partial [Streptococcus pneumoniae]